MPPRVLKSAFLSRRWVTGAVVVADMDVVEAATNTIAGIMVHAIGTVVVATDTTTAATGMRFRGGLVDTVRLTTVHTIMAPGDHSIQAAVAITGLTAVARTGAGAATFLAA